MLLERKERNARAPVENLVKRICRQPKQGDRLEDSNGEMWTIVTLTTLRVCEMAIAYGEEFVYAD